MCLKYEVVQSDNTTIAILPNIHHTHHMDCLPVRTWMLCYALQCPYTTNITYLALMGELWGVNCEDFGENWQHYNSTALYVIGVISESAIRWIELTIPWSPIHVASHTFIFSPFACWKLFYLNFVILSVNRFPWCLHVRYWNFLYFIENWSCYNKTLCLFLKVHMLGKCAILWWMFLPDVCLCMYMDTEIILIRYLL